MGKIFISVDVECAGSYPPEYSMLSLGAAVVGQPDKTFYVELKPINDNYELEALGVAGFTMEGAMEKGKAPEQAMTEFADWIDKVGKKRAKFVAFPAGFDWMFTNYYLLKYAGRNPFGIAPVDIRSVYFGMFPNDDGFTIRKDDMKKRLGLSSGHTHHALDDAKEQAEMFKRMLEIRDGNRVTLQ